MFKMKNDTKVTATNKKEDFIGYSMEGLEHLKPGKDFLLKCQEVEDQVKHLVKLYEALPDEVFTSDEIIGEEVALRSLKQEESTLYYGFSKADYKVFQIGQIMALSQFLDGQALSDVLAVDKDFARPLHDELVKIGRRFQSDILKEDSLITLLEAGELKRFKDELKAIYGVYMEGVKPSNASVAFILLYCLKPKTARKDERAINSISIGRIGTLQKAVLLDLGQKLCKLPKRARG